MSDTGIGISEKEINNLFQLFTQADATTSRKYGGTGLGLMLSRRLAEILNGSLNVESKTDNGSTFTLTIATGPLDDVTLAHSTFDIPKYDKGNEDSDKVDRKLQGRVLLAEDTLDNQILLKRHLQNIGMTVVIAENGKLAIEETEKQEFDLILMDMQMPIMDGKEAVKILREKGITTPIVALTANALKEDRDECFSIGCNEFATKPISKDQLYDIIENNIGKPNRAATG